MSGAAGDIADRIMRDDPYLADYLLGWAGLGPVQPWGAAMSFALEVAHGYRLIRGESDGAPTPLGKAVAQAIEARRAETQGGSVHESAAATPCAQGDPA